MGAARAISPRVKLATRLYVTGAVRTKAEAARAAGLTGSYFTIAGKKPEVQEFASEVDRQLQDKTISLSAVIESMSRTALSTINKLMVESNNEAVKLKAASDLLDRNPETSKTQKHQVSSFALSGEDAKGLAAALVKSAEARRLYGQEMQGDFIRIEQPEEDINYAEQRALVPEVRSLDKVGAPSPNVEGSSAEGRAEDLHPIQASPGPGTEVTTSKVIGHLVVDNTPAGKQLRLI